MTAFDHIISPHAKPFFFKYIDNKTITITPLVHTTENITQKDFQLALGSDAWRYQQGLPGSTAELILIGVSFLGDVSNSQKEWVRKYATEWTSNRGVEKVRFVFDDLTGLNIRVTFDSSEGNRSEIGSQALNIVDTNLSTMNLADVREGVAEEDIRRVVLHEFGHALGLRHEHQHPQSGYVWKADGTGSVVIAAMKKLAGWNARTTRKNIIRTYSNSFRCKGADKFDQSSIMLYPISADWLDSGPIQERNTELSDGDYACARRLYRGD